MSNQLLLDIDLDFFFEPRQSNVWHPWRDMRSWTTVPVLTEALRRAGVAWSGAPVNASNDHTGAYWFWRLPVRGQTKIRDAICLHIDAHADWYALYDDGPNCGNYLRQAIKEGIVGRVYWVLPPYLDPRKHVEQLMKGDVPDLKTLRVEDGYLTGKVEGKPVHLVAGLEDLPRLNRRVDTVTIAGSPGWSPKQADTLLEELCMTFGVKPELSLEKFRQSIRGLGILDRLSAPVAAEELQALIRHEMEAEALKVVAG